jgi:phosphonate transport system substrate-binding protein
VLLLISCDRGKPAKKVSLEKNRKPLTEQQLRDDDAVRIAVGAMITPKEGFAYYKKLLDYIGEQLGRDVEFVDRESYAEINALLKAGKIDVAFVCSGPYVDGHENFGLELLAQPQAYGRTVYYSYIIVPADGETDSFEQLRGKTFAFTDPKSNTGKLVPTYMLARMGETPESYFGDYEFTYGHDKSVKAVVQHLVDGAAVDSLIWEYMNKTNPELTSDTRIIHKSSPYGIPPVVVRAGLDPEIKAKLREILFGVHEDEKGREILRGMMVQKFVPGNDSDYDTIRQMKAWIEKNMTDEQQQ